MLKVEDSIMSEEQRSELPSCIATVRTAVQKKLIEALTKDRQDRADKPKRYVDLAGLHIEKLSRIAAKKKKMRAQASQLGTQQQEENGQAAANENPKESETPVEDGDDSTHQFECHRAHDACARELFFSVPALVVHTCIIPEIQL